MSMLAISAGAADMAPAPGSSTEDASGSSAMVPPELKEKHDFIVWIPLSQAQQAVYRTFLESDKVAQLLNTTKSPLAALNVLKKVSGFVCSSAPRLPDARHTFCFATRFSLSLTSHNCHHQVCDHPRLLASHNTYRHALGFDAGDDTSVNGDDASEDAEDASHFLGESDTDTEDDERCGDEVAAKKMPYHGLLGEDLVQAILQHDVTPAQLLEQSGKLQCFLRLMLELQRTGHRALVFSQSRKMLDMISHVMKANDLRSGEGEPQAAGADEYTRCGSPRLIPVVSAALFLPTQTLSPGRYRQR